MSAQSLEQFRRYQHQQEVRRQRGPVSLLRAGRGAAALSLAVVVLLVGTTAVAAWLSMGSGAGAATATTVNKASAPAVVASGNAAAISWNPVTLANGVAVSGYRVLRHVGGTVTTVCTTTEPTRSCSDNAPSGGTQQYGVVATRGGWSGPESDLTSFVGDTTAPTATFADRSPAPNGAGWNKSDVQIRIQATDAGSGLRSINARYDGTDVEVPVSGATDSAVFTLSREDANAFTYWAVDNAGNVASPSSTQFVRIDKTAPVTSSAVTSQGALVNGWYTKAASVALTATDTSPVTGALASGVTAVQYRTGGSGGTWLTYTGALVVGDGSTVVQYRSVDLADNVELTRSREVKVDSTAPTLGTPAVSGGTPGANGWYVGAVAPVVKVTADDATSGVAAVEYQVGTAGAWTAYDAAVGVSVPESSTSSGTELRFRATDVAGNTTTSPVTVVTYDRTAPSAPSVAVNPSSNDGSNGYYTNAPKVAGQGSTDQGSGFARYEYQLGSGAWTEAASGFAVPDGASQVVGVRAVDVAGNTTAVVSSAALKVDTVKPTAATAVANGTLGQNGYYVSDPTIRFTGGDAQGSGLARLEYSTDGGATYVGVSSGATQVWSTQGTTTFITRATDLAGNASTDTLTVKVDSKLPTAGGAAVSPAAPNGLAGWYRTQPSITLNSGSDVAGGSGYASTDYQLGSTSTGGWLAFATQLLVGDTGPGGTTLYWRARDGAGNTSAPSSLALKVDSTKPATTSGISSGTLGSNGWYRSTVGLVLSTSDAGSGVSGTQYQVTTSPVAPTSWTGASSGTMPSVLTQGTSYVWYRSTDVAGNVEDARSSMVMIDTAVPTTRNAHPTTGTYDKNAVWAGTTSCGAGLVCIEATDPGGSGVATVSYTMVLKDTPSTCFVPQGSGASASTGTIGSTAGCVQTMTDAGSGLYRSGTVLRLPASNKTGYTLTVTVTDTAGNATSATQTITSSN